MLRCIENLTRRLLTLHHPGHQNQISIRSCQRCYVFHPSILQCNSSISFSDTKSTMKSALVLQEGLFSKFRRKYGYHYLLSIPEYQQTFFNPEQMLTQDKIYGFQKHVTDFIEISTRANVPSLTDANVDTVVSKLLSNVEALSDEELFAVLFFLTKFPDVTNRKAATYQAIWKKLDNDCFRRLPHFDWDKRLQVNDLFFMLNLNQISLSHWTVAKIFLRKSDSLPKVYFIRMMFCLSSVKQIHPNINLYPVEFNFKRLIGSMTVEEIAVAASGFNILSYNIKDKDTIIQLLEIVTRDRKELSSEGVVHISRLVHSCSHFKFSPAIYSFLDGMQTELDRITSRSAIYLGLMGASVRTLHEDLMDRIVSKVADSLTGLTFSDIAKLCRIIAIFGTKCDDLCHKIADEVRSKLFELKISDARHFPEIVHFLCMKGFIFEDLIAKTLSEEFLNLCYDNVMYIFKPEILYCDLTAEIELGTYSGPRLTEKQRGYLLKKNMFWLNWLELPPRKVEPEYKRFVRSFVETAEDYLGDPQFLRVTNTLPHYEFADVIFCTDDTDNIVQLPKSYRDLLTDENEKHKIKLLPEKIKMNKNINFHVIMLLNRSACMYNSTTVTGLIQMQRRQIAKLGYTIHQVFASEWIRFIDDDNQKIECMKEVLRTSVRQEDIKIPSISIN